MELYLLLDKTTFYQEYHCKLDKIMKSSILPLKAKLFNKFYFLGSHLSPILVYVTL